MTDSEYEELIEGHKAWVETQRAYALHLWRELSHLDLRSWWQLEEIVQGEWDSLKAKCIGYYLDGGEI